MCGHLGPPQSRLCLFQLTLVSEFFAFLIRFFRRHMSLFCENSANNDADDILQ